MEQGKVIKTFTSKKGNEVVFRYPHKNDFSAVWGFACDLAAEDTFVMLSGAPPSEEEEKKWFAEVLQKIADNQSVHLSVFVNGAFAGNGRVDRGKYRHSHVGHMGLSLAPGYRDEGIGTELMRALIDEAKTLGLRLLTLSCFENNPRALHVYEKLGFKKSGNTPGDILFKGKYIGSIQMYLPLI